MLVDPITNNNLNLKPESLHIVRYEGVVIDFNYSRAFLFGKANMSRFRRKGPLCACGCEEKTKWCPTNKKWNKFIDGHQNRGIYHPNYKGKIEVYCSYCNALKKINRSEKQNKKHHFCNRKCYAKWQSKNKSGKNNHQWKEKIIVRCDYCNKKKEISPCHLGRKNYFCNTKCMGKWMSENLVDEKHPTYNRIIVYCAYCKKEKEIISCHQNQENHFCNPKCWYKWKSENLKGPKATSWKGGKIIVFCVQCNKPKEISPCYQNQNHFCNKKCFNKWFSINKRGPNAVCWKGGKSHEPYCKEWNFDEFKQIIRDRDDNECQNPTCRKNYNPNHKLCVHHIDGNKKNCKPWNLITLCKSCNTRAEGSKDVPRIWWQELYKNIMAEKHKYKTGGVK